MVAPPQEPVGASFPAPCRSPGAVAQVADGFRVTADEQSACAFKKTGIMENKKMGIRILTKRMDFINQFWLRTKDIWTTIILTYIHKYNCMAEDIKYKYLMQ